MDEKLSIGDYVLTGGEMPALIVMDAIARFIPGVLGKLVSAEDDSFSTGLLEYPQYTRPVDFEGRVVPDVLRSGNHALINSWRLKESLKATYFIRPDLLSAEQMQYIEGRLPFKMKSLNADFMKNYVLTLPQPRQQQKLLLNLKQRMHQREMNSVADLYIGLVHYPIYNKRMNIIAGAVTNFDIHDISRTCRTYDVKRYYIIHPLDVQKKLSAKY